MRPRPAVFVKCPRCGLLESAYPARRERRKKDVSTWSMVIPFHSRQFTVAEMDAGNWWCSRCDKAVEQAGAADLPKAERDPLAEEMPAYIPPVVVNQASG